MVAEETIVSVDRGSAAEAPAERRNEAVAAVDGGTVLQPATLVTGHSAVGLALKRCLDVVVAGLLLAVLSLPGLLIVLTIKLDSPGPVFYRQRRVGRHGKRFTLYKFRSMDPGSDDLLPTLARDNQTNGPTFKMRDDPRKTRVGRVLRRMSLDEVPQIVNVLRGDMSLVGPRPPLASEVEAYEPQHWRRLAVAQGMTGLWQISGRSELPFDAMIQLDLDYIERWSVWLDVVILAKTIPAVLTGRGAY